MKRSQIPIDKLLENWNSSIKSELTEELLLDGKTIPLRDYVMSKVSSFKCSPIFVNDALTKLSQEKIIHIDRKEGIISLKEQPKTNTLRQDVKPLDICKLCGFEIAEKFVSIKEGIRIHQGCWTTISSEDYKKLINL